MICASLRSWPSHQGTAILHDLIGSFRRHILRCALYVSRPLAFRSQCTRSVNLVCWMLSPTCRASHLQSNKLYILLDGLAITVRRLLYLLWTSQGRHSWEEVQKRAKHDSGLARFLACRPAPRHSQKQNNSRAISLLSCQLILPLFDDFISTSPPHRYQYIQYASYWSRNTPL